MYNVVGAGKGQMQARKAVRALAWGMNSRPQFLYTFYIHPGPLIDSFECGKEDLTMELVEIAKDLVANLGFPIFCVVMMYVEMGKEREAHKNESNSWVEALNNNTLVMQKLLDRMEARE